MNSDSSSIYDYDFFSPCIGPDYENNEHQQNDIKAQKIKVLNHISNDIEIYMQYYKDLVNEADNQTLYQKYIGKLKLTPSLIAIVQSIANICSFDYDITIINPLEDMIKYCVRDFSLVASNEMFLSLKDLYRSVSVFKNGVAGFYYFDEVTIDNPTLKYLTNYICYSITGITNNKEHIKCFSPYVLNYIRKLRVNGTLLETFGFKKNHNDDISSDTNYFHIKVLINKNTFKIYSRMRPACNPYFYNCKKNIIPRNILHRGVDNHLDSNQDFFIFKYAFNHYSSYLDAMLHCENYMSTNNENAVENNSTTSTLSHNNTIDEEDSNSKLDRSIFNSLSSIIEKGFINRLKKNSQDLTNIDCYINNALCTNMKSQYILTYDPQQQNEPKHFILERIEDTLNRSHSSLNESINVMNSSDTIIVDCTNSADTHDQLSNVVNSSDIIVVDCTNSVDIHDPSTHSESHNSVENNDINRPAVSSIAMNTNKQNETIIDQMKHGIKRTDSVENNNNKRVQ